MIKFLFVSQFSLHPLGDYVPVNAVVLFFILAECRKGLFNSNNDLELEALTVKPVFLALRVYTDSLPTLNDCTPRPRSSRRT